MFRAYDHDIVIRTLSHRSSQGWLQLGTLRFRCAVGRSGLGVRKCEGDGLTPIGRWPIRTIFFRADKRQPFRMPQLSRFFPVFSIRPEDGWCDWPGDANYNRQIVHPYPVSAERLWRDDELYDIIVVLAHNHCPRIKGRGSAIFMHTAEQDDAGRLKPTAGCIALRSQDLKTVLTHCRSTTHVCIP